MKAQFLICIAENDDQRDPEAKNVLKDSFAQATCLQRLRFTKLATGGVLQTPRFTTKNSPKKHGLACWFCSRRPWRDLVASRSCTCLFGNAIQMTYGAKVNGAIDTAALPHVCSSISLVLSTLSSGPLANTSVVPLLSGQNTRPPETQGDARTPLLLVGVSVGGFTCC